MGTTSTRPASAAPGPQTRPRLKPPNVSVSVARMAGPAGGSPSAETPEGTSSAATGRPLALISSIRRATRPSGAPLQPVPRSASPITSARARGAPAGGGRARRGPGPHAARRELPELAAGVAADLTLGEREQDVGPHPRALEPACHDEAVAAVTALAADDGHARPTPGRLESAEQRHDPCGGAAAGVFHEGRTGDAELGDRTAIEAPHLLRREHPVHGGYRPGS